MTIVKQIAAYRAQIELARKEENMKREKSILEERQQQLTAAFWQLKFLVEIGQLPHDVKRNIVEKLSEFKKQGQNKILQEIFFTIKEKYKDVLLVSGRDLETIIEGAKLLGIYCQKVDWKDRIRLIEIEDEQTYKEMVELYREIVDCRNECIRLIDQKLKLEKARNIFLRILKEKEINLAEFTPEQINEIMGSPLCQYLSIKLRGR
ncbi:MAG: hypothetical protein QXO15_07145 [Nitrososphaerota archaeon]